VAVLRRLAVIPASLVALVACAGGGAGTGSVVDPGVGTATSAASASGATASASGGEVPDAAPVGNPKLILEAGGLGVAVDETRVDHLPFGTAAGTVRTGVSRLLGPLTTSRRTDCAQGTRTSSRARGFELLFDGGRFVGWTDTGTSGRHLTTGDGIAVGVTVAALEHSGTQVTLRRLEGGTAAWTSGPGGLDGRATSTSPRGRVTMVSSGETCLPG
jgi:hypothetical protein